LALYWSVSEAEFSVNRNFCWNKPQNQLIEEKSGQRQMSPGSFSNRAPQLMNSVPKTKRRTGVKNSDIPLCLEPIWHSGSFTRWKQMMQLHFGNYRATVDKMGYLRILKGRTQVYVERLDPLSVLFPLLAS
jgi:hypothetical protein